MLPCTTRALAKPPRVVPAKALPSAMPRSAPVSDARAAVDALTLRVENAKGTQARRLADIAVRELEDQRKRLDEYSIQARYALATIYDRAAAGTAPAKPQEAQP